MPKIKRENDNSSLQFWQGNTKMEFLKKIPTYIIMCLIIINQ